MISYGKPEYVEDLKLLWQDTFGDSRRFIDSFFDNVYEAQNTLIHVEDGRAVSSLYMIPYKVLLNGREERVVYLYALATDPSYRGRKIMSNLIKKSFEISAERDYALSFLVPARESLAEFYRKFGYEYSFYRTKLSRSSAFIRKEAKNQPPIACVEADANAIWDLYRNSIYTKVDGVVLSENQNRFYVEEIIKEGGEALILKTEDREYYALLMPYENEIIVYETNLDSSVIKQFYALLLEKYRFKSVTFFQPVCFSEEEISKHTIPFAMAKMFKELDLSKPFVNRVIT